MPCCANPGGRRRQRGHSEPSRSPRSAWKIADGVTTPPSSTHPALAVGGLARRPPPACRASLRGGQHRPPRRGSARRPATRPAGPPTHRIIPTYLAVRRIAVDASGSCRCGADIQPRRHTATGSRAEGLSVRGQRSRPSSSRWAEFGLARRSHSDRCHSGTSLAAAHRCSTPHRLLLVTCRLRTAAENRGHPPAGLKGPRATAVTVSRTPTGFFEGAVPHSDSVSPADARPRSRSAAVPRPGRALPPRPSCRARRRHLPPSFCSSALDTQMPPLAFLPCW